MFYVLSHWRRHRMPCETNSQLQKSSETVNSYLLPLRP
jgi:hypothetical protein